MEWLVDEEMVKSIAETAMRATIKGLIGEGLLPPTTINGIDNYLIHIEQIHENNGTYFKQSLVKRCLPSAQSSRGEETILPEGTMQSSTKKEGT